LWAYCSCFFPYPLVLFSSPSIHFLLPPPGKKLELSAYIHPCRIILLMT
jgi:hypothetical protein